MQIRKENASRKTRRIGKKPFQGYEELRAEELKDLRRMSLKESIRLTEMLLREVGKWKR